MKNNFICKQCGECCKMSPRLDEDDIHRIMDFGINAEAFVDIVCGLKYMRMIGNQCVFLGTDKKNYFCRIYPVRPKICHLYPLENTKDCKPKKWSFDEYLEKRRV